jgi:hypothetical protein
VHAGRVGDERAETYLRLLAEAELRRAGEQIRRVDAATGTEARSRPGMALFATTERAQWKVVRTARILVAAGVLDQECLDSVTSVFSAAIQVRSRLMLNWYRRRGVLHRTIFAPVVSQPPPRPANPAIRVTPIGLTLEVASDRAPSTLQLMSLVATGTEALITVVMRMHWPRTGQARTWRSPDPDRITCRTTSSGPWTTRGLATRRGSRSARARRLPGGALSSFHPCRRATSGGLT